MIELGAHKTHTELNAEVKEPIETELEAMRHHVEALESQLEAQKQIAFAAGIFQNDITVRTLLESLAEGVVVCDPNGYIVLINRRAEELFGYTAREITGHPLSILLPERYLTVHTQHIKVFFGNPHIRPMGHGLDLAGKRKDGSEFPVEVSLSHLNTEVGQLGLAFVTDITTRKQTEWALKLRSEELDAFAHMVAHDLKGSLSTLIGYSEVLAESFADLSTEETGDYLKMLARNGRRMSNIIDELLVFASVRKEDVVPQPIDTAEIVNNTLQRLNYQINELGADVTVDSAFPPALGNALWVEEIWFNYLTNALKYGGNPPVIRIGSATEGNGIKFWITDNGAGLSEAQQQELFKSFTRLENPKIQGHGLGLSIVKRIVEKLNGRVGVKSAPGQGSTFSFTLPAYMGGIALPPEFNGG